MTKSQVLNKSEAQKIDLHDQILNNKEEDKHFHLKI
jgi:hypothetical protein